MLDNLHNDAQFFEERFNQHLQQINSNNGILLLSYGGLLNSENIAKLETEIEGKILEKQLPKMAVKKTFFISIESLQNQFIHGFVDENNAKHNFFILYIMGNQVKMIVANLIANVAIEKIKKHIERINSFENPADLKTYYLEHLENNELSDKGGAGLGFITIGMKSGNKIHNEFETINDVRSMFLMEVSINID